EGLLTPEQELHVYRVVQEALANTARHAGAQHVRVEMTLAAGRLIVSVADDGAGFDRDHPPTHGVGIATMRERAMLMHAELAIASTRGHGTIVRLALPLAADAATDPQPASVATPAR